MLYAMEFLSAHRVTIYWNLFLSLLPHYLQAQISTICSSLYTFLLYKNFSCKIRTIITIKRRHPKTRPTRVPKPIENEPTRWITWSNCKRRCRTCPFAKNQSLRNCVIVAKYDHWMCPVSVMYVDLVVCSIGGFMVDTRHRVVDIQCS